MPWNNLPMFSQTTENFEVPFFILQLLLSFNIQILKVNCVYFKN